MSPSAAAIWRVRPAGTAGQGKPVSFDRLAGAVHTEDVGDLDEVLAPGASTWLAVADQPQIAPYVPKPRDAGAGLQDDSEVDMTPMIDCTFQLLIFFMIAASYTIQKTLDLPASKPEEQQATAPMTMTELEQNNVLVKIAADDAVTVDDQAVPLDDLPARLREATRSSRTAEVVLDVADEASHDVVVQVLDAAGAAQVEKVLFVSRVPPQQVSGIP